MKRFGIVAIVLVVAFAASVRLGYAHFAYVVPTADGSKAQVVFAEGPAPDMNVPIDRIAATTLFCIDRAGKQTPLTWTKSEHALLVELPTSNVQVIGGLSDYGVAQSRHTGDKPVWVKYYPKAIVGGMISAERVTLGEQVPIEIVAEIIDGKLGFQLLLRGKPLPDAECSVLAPGQEKGEKTVTDEKGYAKSRFDKPGRYGVWARYVDPTPGELKGKKYEETRHYATLVVDLAGTNR